jgi:hypothetical protein
MRENNRIIGVQSATLWTQEQHGDLLSLQFSIPHSVIRPLSVISDDEARERNMRLVLKASQLTQAITPPAEQEQWIEAKARSVKRDMEMQHVYSGMAAAHEKIVAHLKSRGYAASSNATSSGEFTDLLMVNIQVANNPKLALNLAHSLNDAGLLEQRTLIREAETKAGAQGKVDDPSYHNFIIDLNQAVLEPPSVGRKNIR